MSTVSVKMNKMLLKKNNDVALTELIKKTFEKLMNNCIFAFQN